VGANEELEKPRKLLETFDKETRRRKVNLNSHLLLRSAMNSIIFPVGENFIRLSRWANAVVSNVLLLYCGEQYNHSKEIVLVFCSLAGWLVNGVESARSFLSFFFF
jgi:hypothetical protein